MPKRSHASCITTQLMRNSFKLPSKSSPKSNSSIGRKSRPWKKNPLISISCLGRWVNFLSIEKSSLLKWRKPKNKFESKWGGKLPCESWHNPKLQWLFKNLHPMRFKKSQKQAQRSHCAIFVKWSTKKLTIFIISIAQNALHLAKKNETRVLTWGEKLPWSQVLGLKLGFK